MRGIAIAMTISIYREAASKRPPQLYMERGKFMRKFGKVFAVALVVVLLTSLLCVPAFAAAGNVSSAIEGTWNSAKGEVKNVVNNVVFPVLDLVLAVFFFVKLGGSYFEYRKHGQFEIVGPAILFACLIFTLTAPSYLWTILGM